MTTLMLFILSKQKYYKKWFKIFRPYWNDAEKQPEHAYFCGKYYQLERALLCGKVQ